MCSVEEVLTLEDWAENPKKGSKDKYEILD